MFLTEYNQEKVLEKERKEGRREGRNEGRKEGRKEGAEQERSRVASDLMSVGGMTADFIAQISKLSIETVRQMAKDKGIILT